MKKKPEPQEVLDKKRQATLQFMTVAERDEWINWYRRDGTQHFWGWLATFGPRWYKTKIGLKWRKVAKDRLKYWPDRNERFVE